MIPNLHHFTSPASPMENSMSQMTPAPRPESPGLYHHPVLHLTAIPYDFKANTSTYHEHSNFLTSSTISRPPTPRSRHHSTARSLFVALGILLSWIILVQAIRPLVFGGTPIWERPPSALHRQEPTFSNGDRSPPWDTRSRSNTTPTVVKPTFGLLMPPTMTWTTTTTAVAGTTTVIIAPEMGTGRMSRQPTIALDR